MTDELRDELHEKILDSCLSFGLAAATNDLVKGEKAVDAILALIQSENSRAVKSFAEKLKYAVNPAAPKNEGEKEEWELNYAGMDIYDLIDDLLSEPHDIFPGILEE